MKRRKERAQASQPVRVFLEHAEVLLGVGVELVEEGARLDRDETHHEA